MVKREKVVIQSFKYCDEFINDLFRKQGSD